MNTIRLNTIGTPFPKAEGGGGGNTMEYLDVSGLDDNMRMQGSLFSSSFHAVLSAESGELVSIILNYGLAVVLMGISTEILVPNIKYLAFEKSARFYDENNWSSSSLILNTEPFASCPRITEEEFYTIETA